MSNKPSCLKKTQHSKMSFYFSTTTTLKNEFFNDLNKENLKSTLFDSFFELKNYRCKNFSFFATLPSLEYDIR